MGLKVRNNFKTTLTRSITATSTELQLDTAPWPAITLQKTDDHFLLMLTNASGAFEIIKCVGILGRIVTVGTTLNTPSVNGRGYDDTTAITLNHTETHTIRIVANKGIFEDFISDIEDIEAASIVASEAEAIAGVENTHTLPSLRGRQMLDGYAPIASQSEAETGTDNVKRMTPLREKQNLDTLIEQLFPSGTCMFFPQNTVPTNWIFDADHNDMVLLNTSVESEGGDTGGNWTLVGMTVDGHQLTIPEMPSHDHGLPRFWSETGGHAFQSGLGLTAHEGESTGATGGGQEHDHGLTNVDWRPAYRKVISCYYKVAPPSFGSEYIFNPESTSYISCTALDSTHFMVCYSDNAVNGVAIIGTVSGNTISFGSEYIFNTGTTSIFSCTALDSTHFVVCYRDQNNSDYGTAIIGTVSGDVISFGSEHVFNIGYTNYISCVALDSTHFVLCYRDHNNSDYGTAIIGTVSGDVISFGSEYVFNTDSTYYISCTPLDSTHFVVCYSKTSGSYLGTAIVGTVSGDVISFGSEYVFNTVDATVQTDCKVVDSTHFLLNFTYFDGLDSYSQSLVGSVSGSIITFGSSINFTNFGGIVSDGTACCVKDATTFIVLYYDENNSNYGTIKVGTISGGVISFSDSQVFNDGTTYALACDMITTDNVIICYRDYSNGNYGTSIIGTVT